MKSRLVTVFICTLALVLAGVGTATAGSTGPCWMTNDEQPYKGFVRGWALISPEELKSLMEQQQAWNNRDSIANGKGDVPTEDPKLVIIDVGKPKLHYAAQGHIPGAYNTWRPDYAIEQDKPGGEIHGVWSENLLPKAEFQEFLRGFGIDNDSQVVFYDHKYDATRLWWACKYYGFNVRVLDGGLQAWSDAGYEVDHLGSPDQPAKGNLVLPGGMETMRVEIDAVWKCKDDPVWKLWDIRSMKEIDGRRVRAKRMGKIPFQEALVPWKVFHVENGPSPFKDAKAMQAALDEHGFDPADHHVFFCQSGVRTTQAFFALYLMGYPMEHLHNYDSSWIEWGNAPDTPIVNEKDEPVPYKE